MYNKIMKYVENLNSRYIEAFLYSENDEVVSRCKITFTSEIWRITEWYTNENYQHQGYGLMVLRHAFKALLKYNGEPKEIHYVWNRENAYVFEWLEKHFAPVCFLPIEVRKYMNGDDWRAHIYVLDKERFIKYMCA